MTARPMVLCFLAVVLPAIAARAEPGSRPNVLFCIADDASYPHMGAYGCPWIETPGFDRVAKEGLLLTNAYTPNAKCSPSRACILTGRNTWQLKEACNHIPFFPAEFKTYAEALAEHGYFVGKTAKGWAPGVARDANGKPRQLTGTPFDKRTKTPPASGISPNDYAANFEDFLQAKPKDQPWCFWYGGFEPHRRYEYGSGVTKGGKQLTDLDHVFGFWPDNEVVRNDILDYALEIQHFDQHLVTMLQRLEARGELDNTLVVVTADNGMPFPRIKGQEYELSNHLPLAIMWKRGIKSPGRVINDYVSFIDFAPTFIELAGLKWDATGMSPSPGRSLTDIFFSDKAGRVNPRRDHILLGKERHDIGRPDDSGYPIRGIVKDGLLYLHNFETSRWPAGNPETGYLNCDGSPTKTEVLKTRRRDEPSHYWQQSFGKRPTEQLFDVRQDPQCLTNLAQRPGHQVTKAKLKEQLYRQLTQQQDPRMSGRGHVFDQYVYADPKTRNFYQRHMAGEKIPAGWVNVSDFESDWLEGIWSVTDMHRAGVRFPPSQVEALRFVFSDGKVTMRYLDQLIAQTKYTTDPEAKPATIRLTFDGQPTQGIYRLDGDKLTICLSGSIDKQPAGFVSEANSPNRMLIVLRRGDLRPAGWPLFVISADGTGLRQRIGLPKGLAVGSPDWSPDGRRLAFDAWSLTRNENYGDSRVYVVDIDGKNLKQLAPGAMPSWSPDSQRMTYCQYGASRGVWIMDADGSNPKLIDAHGWGSDWSPQGNEIAYTIRSPSVNICIVRANGQGRRTILETQKYDSIYWNLSWSPDGKYICFLGDRPQGAQEFAVVRSQGESEGFKVLLSSQDQGQFQSLREIVSWGGDGEQILVSMKGPGDKRRQLYLLDPAGTNPPLRLAGQDPGRDNSDMAWSPNGKMVVFVSRDIE